MRDCPDGTWDNGREGILVLVGYIHTQDLAEFPNLRRELVELVSDLAEEVEFVPRSLPLTVKERPRKREQPVLMALGAEGAALEAVAKILVQGLLEIPGRLLGAVLGLVALAGM